MSQKGFGLIVIIFGVLVVLVVGFFLGAQFNKSRITKNNTERPEAEQMRREKTETPLKSTANLANPASENCAKQGGTVSIQTRGDGGQYGVCQFDDDQSCEEWALLKGECPVGGIKTVGFDTPAQVYCALIGGKTLAVPNAECNLPGGKTCPVDQLYNGQCNN